jgi:hypothetical protein
MGRHIYNARYKEEVAKYGKKDAIIALCYIVFLSIALPLVFGTLSPWIWHIRPKLRCGKGKPTHKNYNNLFML